MKACTKCAKDIPDSAMHCVFCGEKQAAEPAAAKTIMGYAGMAEEVLAAARAERDKQLAAAAPAAAKTPAPQPVAEQPRAPTPDPYGTTQPVDPRQPSRPPSAQPVAPAAQPQQPQMPPAAAAPQGQPYPPPQAQPYPPPQAQPYPPPQGQPYPPPQAQPYPPPQAQPYPPPQGQPYPPPQGQPYPPPQGQPPYGYQQAPAPGQHVRPPYLASETGTRMNAPVEPWAGSLKTMCTVFGALLLVAFVAPWAIAGSKMAFSWDIMDTPETALKVLPILIAVAGIGALVLGLAPVSVTARGVGAAVVGFGPIVFVSLGAFALFTSRGRGASADFEWRLFAMLLGLLILAVGFLIRSTYRSAPIGRYICTAAGALLVLVYVIPSNGRSMVGESFEMLTDAPLAELKVLAIYSLLPLALGALGFVSWAPASTSIGAKLWAWCALLWAAVLPLGVFVIALGSARGDIGDNILGGLMFAYHLPISILAWYALGAYGLATLLGKKLEHA